MIKLKKNEKPILSVPEFSVDKKLSKHLDDFDLTKNLNRHHFSLFLGKAGSGKSSMVIGFLNNKNIFKKVYHNIFLFCGKNSRQSIKDDFWGQNLEDEFIYDNLNIETLLEAYEKSKIFSEEGLKTLFIFDDVQKDFKGECQKILLDMNNNRRHNQISIWFCCQNYFSIPKDIRKGLTDAFIFRVNPEELETILNEQTNISKKEKLEIKKIIFKQPHDFFYINPNNNKFFYNWDEIILP